MRKRMYRWQVPLDDEWHEFPIFAKPVMAEVVDERPPAEWHVDVWAETDAASLSPSKMHLRAFGTGHDIPDGTEHVVSAPRHSSGLVFHVYRRL